MLRRDIWISSSEGELDCYLVTPESGEKYDFSVGRALAILGGLRGEPLRKAS